MEPNGTKSVDQRRVVLMTGSSRKPRRSRPPGHDTCWVGVIVQRAELDSKTELESLRVPEAALAASTSR
jgi:hypothetical protein